jgi:hypothetical protein
MKKAKAIKRHQKSKIGIRALAWLFIVVFALLVTCILFGYFGAQKPISYLPEMNYDDMVSLNDRLNEAELSGSGFTVLVDENGKVKVETVRGEVILSNLIYYSLHGVSSEKWGLDSINVHLISDSTISISGEGLSGSKVDIILTVSKTEPKLDINIKTFYPINTTVEREALVALFDIPVSEVYRKNRQVDTASFIPEYWLQRQGVRFGNANRSALIYDTPDVSSMQLDSKGSELFVNLEYSQDHPHIHIPYQEDKKGRWEDQSIASYNSGSERSNSFSVYFSNLPQIVPRLMSLPYGYLAGYVFTEHADGGDIRVHRAVYFGSDTITHAKEAIGGFVGNKIPSTKSVFYANPEHSSYSSIINDQGDEEYLDFLDQLESTGLYEICLHTPEGENSNRKLLEESIKYMKNRYDAVTWIDHGMYDGKNNRECLVADGLNPSSEYYAADLWEKYNTHYFWSPSVEVIRASSQVSIKESIGKFKLYSASVTLWQRFFSADELTKMNFFPAFFELLHRFSYNGEMNSLNTRQGEAYPTPLYWLHKTRTGSFYSWATDYENDYTRIWKKKADNECVAELQQLDQLINDYGIFVNHGYYCRNRVDHDLTYEHDGRVYLNPYFNKILENMALKRDEGDLYITTIRDLMNYWILTEDVTFKYIPDGSIDIINNSGKPINGLSLIIHSSDVLVNGEIPKFKKVGDDTIFWFNIQPKENVILKLLPHYTGSQITSHHSLKEGIKS